MAGNKLTLELDSSPNKLIKATLLAWMDLPVANGRIGTGTSPTTPSRMRRRS